MEKKKILKIVFLIVLTVIIIFIIHIIRNYIIIRKVYDKQLKFAEATNFSMLIESYDPEGNIEREINYKDGKTIMTYKDFVMWSDKEAEEVIMLTSDKKAIVSSTTSPIEVTIPCLVARDFKDQKMLLAIFSSISYDKIDGEKCYVIDWGGPKDYISIETGKTLLSINGKVGKADGTEYDNIQILKEIKLDEVTDEMVSRPDLSEYEMINT